MLPTLCYLDPQRLVSQFLFSVAATAKPGHQHSCRMTPPISDDFDYIVIVCNICIYGCFYKLGVLFVAVLVINALFFVFFFFWGGGVEL